MFTVYCLMDPCGLTSNKDDDDDDSAFMLWPCHAKPKFHYVDFATKSPDFVADFLRVLSRTKFY